MSKINKLLFLIIFIFNNCIAQNSFITNTINYYKNKNSISYNLTYKFKAFDYDSILITNGKCEMVKSSNDSSFNGYFYYSRKDKLVNWEKLYDGKNIYVYNNKLKTTFSYDISKKEIFPIANNIDGSFIKTYFLNLEKLETLISDKKNNISFSDTIIKNTLYNKLTIKMPDEDEYTNFIKDIYINKKNNLIERIFASVNYKDQVQLNEWIISNIQFNNISFKNIENKKNNLLKKYNVKIFKNENQSENKKNDVLFFPKLNGIQIQTEQPYKAKVTKFKIYDFWFCSCYNCSKSIPFLNKLNTEFGDEIEIIGVNQIDNKTDAISKCKKFIERENVNYSMVLVNEKLFKNLKINTYPTFILTDSLNNIIYSKVGYNKDDDEKITTLIKSLLKK